MRDVRPAAVAGMFYPGNAAELAADGARMPCRNRGAGGACRDVPRR